ncbi:peroxiredoxin type-2 [Coemansia spiralis]|uniref:Thioredoxin-dependent peroxiredoxin n=2 Tax=Coemansia TaxID=4863 RepID=A0A9W8L178_9FUNG|nr:Redoxin domain protein [Coemansia spiralis]KAJ1996006.1 peroxiredoxin type-2 [Coemansia umbellata]KAJ2625449.1 peroxiredoxin type-2 [Coemansia sp. RSA 1358]KAJ2680572.1 peroxiredoxin type-2 [Coemansia spiralis]
MTIKIGDEFPQVQLKYVPYDAAAPNACKGPQLLDTKKDFAGKKVVIVGVPGAFSPTCSAQHLPAYVSKVDEIKAKGVDLIVCVSGNDFFVMDAWGKQQKVDGKIIMAGDANGDLGRATGLALDLSKVGLGPVRLTRFAAIVDNGKVSYLAVEPDSSEVAVSGAGDVLAAL